MDFFYVIIVKSIYYVYSKGIVSEIKATGPELNFPAGES